MLSGLAPSELEAILLHELAHIRRHDFLVNMMQTWLETLFFYHPAVWWLSHTLRCEREHCCDETASQALGSCASYGRALLKLEELRGPIPSLALGATQGSLLRRIERLASGGPSSTTRTGAAAVLLLALTIASTLGWGLVSAPVASAQYDANRAEEAAAAEGAADGGMTPQERAIDLHRKAAQIDALPRFFIHAKAGTRTFKPMANPADEPFENLVRSLDEPIVDEDWYRYEKTFAWDSERFIDETYSPAAFAPDQPESMDPAGNPPSWHTRWGTSDLGGERGQRGNQPATHVLRASATAMWKDNTVTNPNYLLATTHRFWFGDNSYRNQNFSAIPPERSLYRERESEEFDGEMCDVIESPTRQERLWFSRQTGRLRGYLQLSYHDLTPDFHKSEAVERIAGRTFATQREYADWYREHYEDLPPESQEQLTLAWLETKDFEKARPSLLIRFRNYREVAPGVWWPFHEDRAQGFPSDKGFECMLSTYRVQEIKTDVDLGQRVDELMPREGEHVQDQRFASIVSYEYSGDLAPEKVLELVEAEGRKRQQDAETIARMKEPYQALVGKPAPALPTEGWIGGRPPEVAGKPYLVHFWAVWCGPCKNDYPLLDRLAESGATIVSLHPASSEAADIEKAMQDAKFERATYIASKDRPGDDG